MQITTVFDIVIAVLLVGAVWRGYRIGLVRKVAQLLAIIFAYIGAGILGDAIIDSYFTVQQGTGLVARFESQVLYAFVFAMAYGVLSFILMRFVRAFKIIDRIPIIGTVNHVVGAVVGFIVEFILIYVILILFFGIVPQTALDGWGLTESAINDSVLLSVFVS